MPKSPQVWLGDILIMVPGFLEDNDILNRKGDLELRNDLLARLETQLIKLFEWRWNWEIANGDKVSQTPVPEAGKYFSRTCLHFTDFELATEIILYNAIHMWLAAILYRLISSTASALIISVAALAATNVAYPDPVSRSSLLLPGSALSLHDIAMEIGHVFEYQCTRAQASQAAAYWYLYPVGLACSMLVGHGDQERCLREMLDLDPVTRGYLSSTQQNETGFGFYIDSNK